MTISPDPSSAAALRLSTLLLVLAVSCLGSCRSAPHRAATAAGQPATAASSRQRGIDLSYLLAIEQLKAEKQQALQDSRLKELSPAEMRQLEDAFESRLQTLRGEWQEARVRLAQDQ